MNHVLEQIGKDDRSEFDVTAYLQLKGWDDPAFYVRELFKRMLKEGIIPSSDLYYFSSAYIVGSSMKLMTVNFDIDYWSSSLPSNCGPSRVFTRNGLLIVRTKSLESYGYVDISPTYNVYDVELGRDVPYHLYAFTSDSSAHVKAYVKRRDGTWYVCNDNSVAQVKEDQLPITQKLQSEDGFRCSLLFYLRTTNWLMHECKVCLY